MTSVDCEALAPTAVQIVAGRRLFRSTHAVTVSNDSSSDITYNIDIALSDSLGNIQTKSLPQQVAPGRQASMVGPVFLDLDANVYQSGAVVDFSCETRVTGGTSGGVQQTSRVTIP